MSELLSIVLFLASVAIYASKAGRNTWWFTAILLVLGFFVLLNITLYASNYFTGDGINDAVIYTLTNSLTGAGVRKYLLPGAVLVLALTAVFGALAWILRRRRHRPYHFGYSLLALLMALASVDASPAFHQITELVKSQSRESDPDFAEYYREPAKKIPNPKLNLVYIYGESLERTYFDDAAFPGLAPELGALKEEGLDFSQTEQLPGTDYTIAGMVASQCGIPLFAPFEGNASASVSSFFPQNTCLGDILKNSGYQNYFVQGANLRFAGKDVFLKSHGFDYLVGAEELKREVSDPKYRNDWGFYDDTVLDEVWKKYEALSRSGQRFSLFALTVDTHHPDGFISRTCSRKSYSYDGKPNQSFSAVTCSQQHIAALINKIKTSPWFKDTVIVVSSDHLAMNNTAWKYLNKEDRKNLFFVLRGDEPRQDTLAVKRSTMDNGATVLDILGGDNYLGLGRSSLSGQSLSGEFLNMKEKIVAWKPDIIRLWNFPKQMKDFTIDRDKKMIASPAVISAFHYWYACHQNASNLSRKANTLRRCVSSSPISPHAITLSGLINATRWPACGRRSWCFPPTGVYRKGSLAVNRKSRRSTKISGKAKPPSKTPSSAPTVTSKMWICSKLSMTTSATKPTALSSTWQARLRK